jgi:preprotein translocase subunit SecF
MAAQNQQQTFFEVIKPGSSFEFIGMQRYWIGLSIFLVALTILMLPLNAYVFKSRGHMLNWGVDFRGGTELVVEFSKPVDAGEIRKVLTDSGHDNADVVKYEDPTGKSKYNFMLRIGAVSVLNEKQVKEAQELLAHEGAATLKKLEWAEGGDKFYLRYDRALDPEALSNSLKAIGIKAMQVQPFGRAEENTYEVTLVGLDSEIRNALDAHFGADAVSGIPQVESVGAKAGKQLQYDAARSLLFAILLIMIYIAFRFDFRYGPGTVVALLHDAVIVIGAFAVTYKEFSLTTVAAVLTIIGFSMNDTIVVFDRIRENLSRRTSESFETIADASLIQTMSRSLNTSLTVIFTLSALSLFGGDTIREFTLALLIGIASGTYSSIFNASMILVVWENEEYRHWFGNWFGLVKDPVKPNQPSQRRQLAGTRV